MRGIYFKLMNEIKLAQVSNEDLDLFEKIYMDPNMFKYIGDVLTKQEVLAAHNHALRTRAEEGAIVSKYFVISLTGSNIAVGIVGVNTMQDNVSVGELGVMVLPEWQGHQIALGAFKILIARIKANKWYSSLVAHTDESNQAANSIFVKLGYNLSSSEYIEKYKKKMNKWEKSLISLTN